MRQKLNRGWHLAVVMVLVLWLTACGSVTTNKVVTPTAVCSDKYEEMVRDDKREGAKVVVLGESQTRSFDSTKDTDWAKVTLRAGWTYSMTTSNLGSSVDTSVSVEPGEGVKGKTVINDDDLVDLGNAPASRVDYKPDMTGTYYIKITNRLGLGDCGDSYGYTLSVDGAPIPTPTPTTTALPTSTPSATPTAATGLRVAWIDQEQKVQVLDAASGTIQETWSLTDLIRYSRVYGVISNTETLKMVVFASSGKVGLQIVPENGKPAETIWLRVGSLPGYEGMMAVCDNNERVLKAWRVTASGPWERVK